MTLDDPVRTMANPLSYSAALVLQALSQGHGYGFEIMRLTGLPSGTVYPLFRRLDASGLVESKWEEEDEAHADRRPARRYYELTAEGVAALEVARARIVQQSRLFGSVAAS